MIKLAIWELIRRSIIANKCGFEGEFKATARGFECPDCGNHDPKTCDCVKRTCGYLGNPLQRPMVHGRHEEIAARAKNIAPGDDD